MSNEWYETQNWYSPLEGDTQSETAEPVDDFGPVTPVTVKKRKTWPRVAGALASIQTGDLREMIDDGEDIEVKCHFCNSAYKFTPEDLKAILARRLAENVSVAEVGSVDSDR